MRRPWLLVVMSLLVQLLYLSKTAYDVRTYDVIEGGGHLDYIAYVYNNRIIPRADGGWQYHHPPLYYIVVGPVWSLSKHLGSETIYLLLRLVSIAFYTAFLVVSVLILKVIGLDKSRFFIALVAVICLWPSGIIHSARIGNDVFYYLLYALSTYFLIRWWRGRDGSLDFLWSAVFAALVIFTKSNGITLLFLLGITAIYRAKSVYGVAKYMGVVSMVLLVALFSFIPRFQASFDRSRDWLNSSVHSLNKELMVPNRVSNLIYFDVKSYLLNPFTDSWDDTEGRLFFWNFLLKSSLFGEFSFDGMGVSMVASFLGVLLLMMIGLFAVNLVNRSRNFFQENFVLVSMLVVNLVALLFFRIKLPYSCHADFRYIYPVLIPFVGLMLLDWRVRSRLVETAIQVILWTFFALCLLLFLII